MVFNIIYKTCVYNRKELKIFLLYQIKFEVIPILFGPVWVRITCMPLKGRAYDKGSTLQPELHWPIIWIPYPRVCNNILNKTTFARLSVLRDVCITPLMFAGNIFKLNIVDIPGRALLQCDAARTVDNVFSIQIQSKTRNWLVGVGPVTSRSRCAVRGQTCTPFVW